jgi:hypothetical protein
MAHQNFAGFSILNQFSLSNVSTVGASVNLYNGYYFFIFTSGSTNTITFNTNIVGSVLIVAGGGGGGAGSNVQGTYNGGGGGGGGGGVGVGNLTFAPNVSYTITVGAGGAGASGIVTARPSQGGSSSIVGGTISEVANGGGAGGYSNGASAGQTAGNGGSGGGAFAQMYGGGTATRGTGTLTYYGNSGGSSANPYGNAAGGGGATSSAGGSGGGSGYTWSLNGQVYGSGGGGGGVNGGSPGGPGGVNAASGSALNSNAINATNGYGGGGGGATPATVNTDQTTYNGSNGGSGVVIIAVATTLDKIISSIALTALRCIYSFKLVITKYLGPILNVRRASDNASLNFYADAYGNIGQNYGAKGTSLSTWLASTTGYVVTWYDQSGLGNHLVQNNTAYQPQIILNDAGGICIYLNTISGTNASQMQSINNIFTTSTVVDSHIVCALKSLTYVSNATIDLNSPAVYSGTSRYGCHLPWSDGTYYYDAGDALVGSGRVYSTSALIPAGTKVYFSGYKQSSTTSEGFNVNGYIYSSNTNPAASVGYLGINFSDGGINTNHYMYALSIFSKSLYNTSDESNLISYFGNLNYNTLPLTISGCILWLDANDPYNNGTKPTNNTSVYMWYDKSGNRNHGSASAGVTWSATGLNNLPGFSFTNLFSQANFFTGSVTNTNATMTIFAVCLMSSASTASARVIGFSNGNGVNDNNNASFMGFLRQSSTGLGPYRNGVYAAVSSTSYGVPYVWSCWFDGTNEYASVQIGSSSVITQAASSGNFAITYYCVGSNTNTGDGNGPLTGYISEIIVYNTSLSAADRQKMENYLSYKWGLGSNYYPI